MAITTLDTARPAASTTNIVSGAVTLAKRTLEAVSDLIERRRTVAMLSELSDAQLEDMGITRGDIERIVIAA